MNHTAWPGSYKAAASFTFDFDAETVWVALDPANAHRPGVLSIGAYGARVGVSLILDTLARHSVRATFFVVGRNAELYPELVKRMITEGHEVAIHGYTHTPPAQLSPEEEDRELVKARNALEAVGATLPDIARPPGTSVRLRSTCSRAMVSNIPASSWPIFAPIAIRVGP